MSTSTLDPNIDVKSAAGIAAQYLRELIPAIAAEDISLEEVELSDADWLVTLGFTDPHALPFQSGRAYKQFRIDAHSGAVSSMRIRKP